MTTTIRITDPVDLVKVVPYQLGYHPERSIVLVGLRRKQVGLVQRLDLPTLPRDCSAAAELMSRHLRGDGCTAAVLVVSALIRGSYHLYQGFGGFIGNVVMGLVFGWAYQRWGRALPLIVAHWVLDIVSFVGYPLALALWPALFG